MKCSNCNNELPEGALFCVNCGSKVETVAQEVPAETAPVEEATVEVTPVEETPVEATPVQETPVQETPVQATPAQEAPKPAMAEEKKEEAPKEKDKKKAPIGLIIGIAAAAVVLILLVVLVSSLFKSNDNQLAYLKGDTIYYLDNMTKEDAEALPVCEVKGDYAEIWNSVVLTEDGKYIYYFSKVDDYSQGTLSRIKVSKITDDADENEDIAEKISNDVKQYTILEDGKTVIYCKTNGKVVLYDGKNEEDIAKNISRFYLSEDEKYLSLYSEEDDDYESAFSIYNLKTDEEVEVTDNLSTVYYRGENKIIYGEYDDDYNVNIYQSDYDGDSKEIISGVYGVNSYDEEDDKMYYVVARTESHKLYDYVDDPYASSDAGITEPKWTDYIAVSSWQAELSEDDYEYYFIENPQYNKYFISWELDYDYAKEHYRYVKYVEDAEGNSVRVVSYYNKDADVWYSFDQEKFDAAEEAYYDAKDRIELRQELKEQSMEMEIFDLYLWEKGEETLVAENLLDYDYVNEDLVFFTSNEEDNVKVSIDDIYSVYDVEYQVKYGSYESYDEETDEEADEEETKTVSYALNGKVSTLEVSGEIYSVDVSADEKSLVLVLGSYSDECTLDLYSVSGSEIKFEETIEEEAMGSRWIDNCYYYYTDVSDDMGTLYVYKNGKSEKILSNAYATGYSNTLFEDGNYMTLNDGENDDYVLLLKNGEKVKFRSINKYTYIAEDKILYIKNDSLYLYLGKDDDNRIARDVISYYCSKREYGSSF